MARKHAWPAPQRGWDTSLAQHPTAAGAAPDGQPMCACVVGHKGEVAARGSGLIVALAALHPPRIHVIALLHQTR